MSEPKPKPKPQVSINTIGDSEGDEVRVSKPRMLKRLDAPSPGLWRAKVLARTLGEQSLRRITLLVTIVGAKETETIGWTCRPNEVSYHAVTVPVGTKLVVVRYLQSESIFPASIDVNWLGTGLLARLHVSLAARFNSSILRNNSNFRVVQAIEASNGQEDEFAFGKVGSDSLSILMPSRDQPELLELLFERCFKSLLQKGGEVIIVDHASTLPTTAATLKRLEKEGCIISRAEGTFNYSRLINQAAKLATRPRYLILNDDVRPLSEADFNRLCELDGRPAKAIIAPLLVYPEAEGRALTVQHAGAFLGMGGLCGHWLRNLPLDAPEVVAWRGKARSVDALTGAAMLVDSAVFDQVGGFDEKYQVECSDIDFCLRASKLGWACVLLADCVWIHPESVSRGTDENSILSRPIWRDRRRFWLQWHYELATVSFLPGRIDGTIEMPRIA